MRPQFWGLAFVCLAACAGGDDASPDDEPNVGVRNPDLRSFDSGNSSHGEYRSGTPMKSRRPSRAMPTFFSLSISIDSARRNQSSRGATQVVMRPRRMS